MQPGEQILTAIIVVIGIACVGIGWRLGHHDDGQMRVIGAVLITFGILELAGAPMWAQMLLGTFR